MYTRVAPPKNQNQFFFHGAQSTRNATENYKKKIADFRKFYYTIFLMNLHHFSYFDPTKKSEIFFYNFQRLTDFFFFGGGPP